MSMRGGQYSSDHQKKASLKQSFKVCFCFRRIFRVKMVEAPEEVKHVFNKYSNNGTMSLDDLHKFLVEFQGEKDARKEDAQEIFNSLRHLNIFQRRGLHIEAFFRYLLSDQNDPIISRPGLVHHDMTAPLAHYFLYTGHNSYLTGNQFNSDSSTLPIIEALKKGVRVIELDLWPNSRGNDAEMVKDIFGEMLYIPDSQQLEFPSPQSLKRKVMISTKPPEYPDAKELATYDDGEEEYDENAIMGYRNLIGIHAGKPKGDKENWFAHQSTSQVKRLSLSEQELEDVAKTHATDIVRFTQRNLLRIYPKGTRLDSSNYDPMVGWMHGAQMVAFNMQVGICGVPADTTWMKRTKAIEDEWNPVWNEEFRFALRVPELALLRIEALEYDTSGKHDFGGQTCLPVWELKTGIRAVPLYSRKGHQYPSISSSPQTYAIPLSS
ncbi:phosphoinositide phospholipase C 2-like [Senna tora]|uniref:Phosphoinositide phospholipase C n=1 Tax=Senna tora TaxID=362788 RepID=A0A834T8L1_9FABA|nr:phosphoinositide phospholipase C 2-like [Senna tora]